MIIRPFNGVFFLLLAICAACVITLTLTFKNKSDKAKKLLIVSICAANVVVFFIYKGFLSVDAEFLKISGIDKFEWWNELPLQLCNINMFMVAIGVLTGNKGILGFSFYTAPLGAFMALATPEPAFINYSLFVPRILGFHVTHLIIITTGILIVSLGFYKPNLKSLPAVMLVFVSLAFGIHLVNTLLRATVCPIANYFFTYSPNGVSLLTMFWKWIPIRFLYLLPGGFILLFYMMIICISFFAADKIKETKQQNKEKAITNP